MKQLFRFRLLDNKEKEAQENEKEEEEPPNNMAVLRRARTLANHKALHSNMETAKDHKCSQHQNRRRKGDMHMVDERNMHIKRSSKCNTNMDTDALGEKYFAIRNDKLKMYKSIPKQKEGEQIVAGWPPWLIAVASEALRGWIPRRADTFQKITKIGQGAYSNVYKAYDKENGKLVALKKVRFNIGEPRSVRFMAREIKVLRRLNPPNVVSVQGLATSRTNMSCSLYLVLDYMDHDLSSLLHNPNISFTEAQVKCCLLQILRGVEHCHRRGVLHRDLKASNLLLDSSGNLKIADFGLATFFRADRKQRLTPQLVTLWYRSPELLLGATEYGVGVDLWSVGCILGELFTGRPLLPGRTEVEQLHKVFKLCGSPSEEFWQKYKLPHANVFKPQRAYARSLNEMMKDLPQPPLDLLNRLLAIDPQARGTASAALKSEFFTAKPLPCDPSSLPKSLTEEDIDPEQKASKARRSKTERREHRSNARFRGSSRDCMASKDASGDTALPLEQQHTIDVRGGMPNPRRSSVGQIIEKELAPSPEGLPLVNTHTHTLSSGSSYSGMQDSITNGTHEWPDCTLPALMSSGSRHVANFGEKQQQRVADLSKLSALVAAARSTAGGQDCKVSLEQWEKRCGGNKAAEHEQREVLKLQGTEELSGGGDSSPNLQLEKTAFLEGVLAREFHFSDTKLYLREKID